MTHPMPWRPALVLGALALLAGCGELPLPGEAGRGDAGPGIAGQTSAAGQDVEVPEVFQVTEAGLWDGRPSLGGVWVAHPEVDDPERVIVRNLEAGTSITAALFRREREAPGPRIQVSSQAAEALGMFAGQPQQLSVTALRPADPEAVTPAIEEPEEIDADPLPPAETETGRDETGDGAAGDRAGAAGEAALLSPPPFAGVAGPPVPTRLRTGA